MKTWLQLLRVPNLFTVPGDPLAGYLLTSLGVLDFRVAYAIAASLCFYAAGLLMNDLCDLEEDRRDRPDRPLPSGAASRRAVWILMIVFVVAGLGALILGAGALGAWLGVAMILAITSYNRVTKTIDVVGPLNMGLCRGLSVLAGAVVADPRLLPWKGSSIAAAGIVAFYIATVTSLAAEETKTEIPILTRLLPLGGALLGLFLMIQGTGPILQSPASALFATGVALVAAETGTLFRRPTPSVPPIIGTLIRVLLIFQAAFCLALGNSFRAIVCGIALLCLFPISRVIAKRFYAS